VDVDRLPGGAGEPEEDASRDEQYRQLRHAVSQLPPEKRLLLQLRYEQGLTLKKVADLLNLGDPFRARREIQSALDALDAALRSLGLREI